MALASLRRLLRSRWSAWLLAWALCLPVAQWASAVHGLLHFKQVAAEEREAPAKLPVSCELCVVAAALGAMAPGATTGACAIATAPNTEPAGTPAQAPSLALVRAYRSRAPPILHA